MRPEQQLLSYSQRTFTNEIKFNTDKQRMVEIVKEKRPANDNDTLIGWKRKTQKRFKRKLNKSNTTRQRKKPRRRIITRQSFIKRKRMAKKGLNIRNNFFQGIQFSWERKSNTTKNLPNSEMRKFDNKLHYQIQKQFLQYQDDYNQYQAFKNSIDPTGRWQYKLKNAQVLRGLTKCNSETPLDYYSDNFKKDIQNILQISSVKNLNTENTSKTFSFTNEKLLHIKEHERNQQNEQDEQDEQVENYLIVSSAKRHEDQQTEKPGKFLQYKVQSQEQRLQNTDTSREIHTTPHQRKNNERFKLYSENMNRNSSLEKESQFQHDYDFTVKNSLSNQINAKKRTNHKNIPGEKMFRNIWTSDKKRAQDLRTGKRAVQSKINSFRKVKKLNFPSQQWTVNPYKEWSSQIIAWTNQWKQNHNLQPNNYKVFFERALKEKQIRRFRMQYNLMLLKDQEQKKFRETTVKKHFNILQVKIKDNLQKQQTKKFKDKHRYKIYLTDRSDKNLKKQFYRQVIMRQNEKEIQKLAATIKPLKPIYYKEAQKKATGKNQLNVINQQANFSPRSTPINEIRIKIRKQFKQKWNLKKEDYKESKEKLNGNIVKIGESGSIVNTLKSRTFKAQQKSELVKKYKNSHSNKPKKSHSIQKQLQTLKDRPSKYYEKKKKTKQGIKVRSFQYSKNNSQELNTISQSPNPQSKEKNETLNYAPRFNDDLNLKIL